MPTTSNKLAKKLQAFHCKPSLGESCRRICPNIDPQSTIVLITGTPIRVHLIFWKPPKYPKKPFSIEDAGASCGSDEGTKVGPDFFASSEALSVSGRPVILSRGSRRDPSRRGPLYIPNTVLMHI